MSVKSVPTPTFEIQLPLVCHDKPESKFRTSPAGRPLLAHLTHQNPKNSVRQAESARTQIGVRAHFLLRIRHKALPAPGADTGANLRRKGLRNASLPSESATLALGEFSRSSRVVPLPQFAPEPLLWPAATDAMINVLFSGLHFTNRILNSLGVIQITTPKFVCGTF